MTCDEIREVLSDLIDVRNGEMPAAGESRMSEPGMRADAEAHLAVCGACRSEMFMLEEVGAVYAGFSVGELPVQHFANYGQVVRARMSRSNIVELPMRRNNRSRWYKFSAVASIAACAAFAFLQFKPKTDNTRTTVARTARLKKAPVAVANRETRFSVSSPRDGVMPIPVGSKFTEWTYNPAQPKPVIDRLQSDEGKYGYLVMFEKAVPGEQPMLGLMLRTTRDKDVDRSNDSLGLEIYDILPGSVGYEMGLMRNDVIVSLNGEKFDSGSAESGVRFLSALHNLGHGSDVTVDFLRRDEQGLLYIQRSGVLGEPKALIEK